ncbi:LAFE_0C13234g1_1 [Lachancea fermentati]|uniref:LAFE_0C13234g1_1 n=1 Tax=Lachancea fermentati TaxID=4955 RepID=A0A1G4MAH9_LACFM|nr:LAFE_0C13234g1_1 [Lachancea fermentati]
MSRNSSSSMSERETEKLPCNIEVISQTSKNLSGSIKQISGSKDKDVVYDFIVNFDPDLYAGEKVDEKEITKKLDKTFLLPLLITYLFQFLDKVALNYAKVMGLAVDLKLVGNQFSDLPTYFFVAYIIAEFFQGFYIIQKFPVAKVLAVNVFLWGIFITLSACATNFAGIMVLRVLLGVTESCITPCLILLTTSFYSKKEGTFRMGIWYSGLGFGQIVGGIISFLFQLIENTTIPGWKIMFIFIGALNIFCAIYLYMFIPSTPLDHKGLSELEKYTLLVKLSAGKIGVTSKKLIWSQIVELFCDIQAYLLLIISATISFSSNTISTFSSIDIMSFGFSAKEAALLNMPSGVVSIISSFLSTFFIMKGVPRYLAITVLIIPAVIGAALMSFLPKSNQAGLLVGIYMINTITAPLAICYSWAGVNFAGSTKKIGSTAVFISIGFALGNIVGPQSYRVKDAPDYYPAKISMLITQAVSIPLAWLIALIYYLRNKRRNAKQALETVEIEDDMLNAWSNLTDFQNKSFRYSY